MRSPFLLLLCLIVLALTSFSTYVDAKDLYGILGLQRDATDAQIKKAFRKLSKQYHPDFNPNDEAAKAKYIEISEAHDILSDRDKRQIYDIDGYEALTQPPKPQFHDPFAAMFNRQPGNNGRPRGPNAKVEVKVTLEDLYNGKEMSISFRRNVICPKCRGSGAADGDTITCPICRGRGQVPKIQQMGPIQIQTAGPCDHCSGKGKIPKNKCPHCSGQRVVPEARTISFHLERGMKHNEEIVFQGESEQSPHTTPGDVVAIIQQAPHPRFRRDGDDLHMDLRITLTEALLGWQKSVLHLDGQQVPLKHSGITQPFEVVQYKGQGMPIKDTPSTKGSLFVHCMILFPKSLTDAQKQTIEKMFD